MIEWIPSRDDREPFVLPDGRAVLIKYTFVVSPDRPEIGCHGLFRPNAGSVLWTSGAEQPCMLFGGSHRVLDNFREQAAILPCGAKRQKAHEEYLKARKYLWSEMIGRVVSVEGGGKDERDIWVVGVEETSTVDFEMMMAKSQER